MLIIESNGLCGDELSFWPPRTPDLLVADGLDGPKLAFWPRFPVSTMHIIVKEDLIGNCSNFLMPNHLIQQLCEPAERLFNSYQKLPDYLPTATPVPELSTIATVTSINKYHLHGVDFGAEVDFSGPY